MTSLVLPKLDREKMQVSNLIVGTSRSIPFELGGKPHALLLGPTPDDYKPTFSIVLKVGEKSLPVYFDRMPEPGALLPQLAGFTWVDFSEDIHEAIAETALEPWLDLLEQKLGTTIELEGVSDKIAADNVGQEIFFEVESGEVKNFWRGHFYAEDELLSVIAQKIKHIPALPDPALESVVMNVRLILGRTPLAAAEFSQVELNDIVLIESFLAGHCTVAVSDSISYNAEIQQQKVIIQSMSTPTPQVQGQKPANAAEKLDALPVHLVFEIGEKQIPYKDLKNIQPGFVIELDHPVERPVAVKANGKNIATGELVQVGEQVGVRITALK